MRKQDTQRHRRNHEPQTGARLRDFETACRELDKGSFGVMRNAKKGETNVGEPSGKILHWRDEILPNRNEEKQIERGKQYDPINACTQHRKDSNLNESDYGELSNLVDCGEFSDQPQKQKGRNKQK